MMKTRKEQIIGTVQDLVGALLWYDRKEDEDLERGEIEAAIEAGEISVDEMIDIFSKELREHTP